MIRALQPPKRKTAWIYGVAATAALSVAIAVVLLRPTPKPQQVAVANLPTPAPVVQTETTPPPAPVKTAETSRRDLVDRESAKAQPKRASNARAAGSPASTATVVALDQPAKDAEKKESTQQVQVQASTPAVLSAETAPPPAPQQFAPKQPGIAGGPRQQQMAAQGRVVLPTVNGVVDSKTSALGFHYSIEIQGHLSIIPAVDGYLFVKSNDGTILFAPKLSAAGIIVDLPLPAVVTSVVITFSETAAPVQTKPTERTDLTGTVEGAANLAVQVRINP
jgi:hypothetical protein